MQHDEKLRENRRPIQRPKEGAFHHTSKKKRADIPQYTNNRTPKQNAKQKPSPKAEETSTRNQNKKQMGEPHQSNNKMSNQKHQQD